MSGGEHVLDTLVARGFVHQMSDEVRLREMLSTPTTYYTGFDPTGPSLTVGHLVPVMMMAHLQQAGHRPIVLSGGGTGMIGDPSGKSTSRPMLTRENVDANVASQREQLVRFLEFDDGRGLVLNNADWLWELSWLEFMRDYGRLFSVNQMLTLEIYRTRLDDNQPLTFLEFSYQLLQAYDFLHLYRTHGCLLQCAGSDQWANCLAGMDLIRRVEGAEAGVLCAPLLTTASGQKMGKTEHGALYLSPAQTSPYDFYQYFVNLDDRDIAKCLKLFTFLSLDEITELCAVEGAALNEAKRRLAWEVTALVHGAPEADRARDAAKALFGGGGAPGEGAPTSELRAAQFDGTLTIVDLFCQIGLAASRSAVKRLVEQGGCYLNEERVDTLDRVVDLADVRDGGILLRAGKKRYHRVVLID
ncbi:MAG TPA: tyrosine--tRNA ligase [Armatimonadetes bacterium]|nr:tyrosine--tRNA ligase [Armatimonadota bacterium]